VEAAAVIPWFLSDEIRPKGTTTLLSSLGVCRELLLGGVGVPLGAGVLLLAQTSWRETAA